MKRRKGYIVLWMILGFQIFSGGNLQSQMPASNLLSEDSTVVTRKTPEDSLRSALETLQRYYQNDRFWRYDQQHLREAIGNLVQYLKNPPIDSTITYLKNYPFPSLLDTSIYKLADDTLTRKGVKNRFVADTILSGHGILSRHILFGIDTGTIYLSDSVLRILPDRLSGWLTSQKRVVTSGGKGDTLVLLSKNTTTFPTLRESPWVVILYKGDTTRIPVTDMDYLIANDSLRQNVHILLKKAENDSTRVCFTNLNNDVICMWLKNNAKEYRRFWLKNEYNDSIGLWAQNVSKNKVRLTVDNNVFFHRIDKYRKKETFLIPENNPNGNKLHAVKPIVLKVNPWKYGGKGSVNLSEGIVSNWAKGGENSVTTLWLLDTYANYNKNKHHWNNAFRFKYGLLTSGEKGIRKNEDSWELDSRYGLKASAKWYYSAAMNLKSQLSNGYKYPNDSVVVSRFMAPAYLFLSLGMDYRPNKKVSVLISPLTWKSTMVFDTSLIDQTLYGIDAGRQVRNDMGAYVKTFWRYDFTKEMYLTSRLNLFYQYTTRPRNLDVDWELNYLLKLGPFFNINIFTHMLYDDTKFPVYDDSGKKIDTTRKLQFKQFLNIGFMYRF